MIIYMLHYLNGEIFTESAAAVVVIDWREMYFTVFGNVYGGG